MDKYYYSLCCEERIDDETHRCTKCGCHAEPGENPITDADLSGVFEPQVEDFWDGIERRQETLNRVMLQLTLSSIVFAAVMFCIGYYIGAMEGAQKVLEVSK